MQVILLENVRNLGKLGEEVTVKNGYGRNYLVPKGIAARSTKANREAFEVRREELERAAAAKLKTAADRGASLHEASITIAARASDEGRLYGSIGTREIAEALTAKTGVELTQSEVLLPVGALREVGEYEVELQLHTDVVVTAQVVLIPE